MDIGQTKNDFFSKAKNQESELLRYDIKDQVGEGGMGKVFKAFDKKLNRVVAIKIMLGGESGKAQKVARFLQEANATAQLNHPNIIHLYDIGTSDGKHFFTMDFIEGTSLENFLERNKKLSCKRAAEIMIKVADAMSYAHSKGIVHRDLKPSNIMLNEQEEPIVMDFGIAKILRTSTKLTRTGAVLGTLYYMSPEQINGDVKQINHRSDIYALGVILYEILSGKLPFYGPTEPEVIKKILKSHPKKLRIHNPKITKDLETICLKCLEKNPERRYATAAALKEDLQKYLEGKPICQKISDPFLKYKISAAILLLSMAAFFLVFRNKEKKTAIPKSVSVEKKIVPIETTPEPVIFLPKGVWAEISWAKNKDGVKKNFDVINQRTIWRNSCLAFLANYESYLHLDFFLPNKNGEIYLEMQHLTSALEGAQGYAPIDIKINNKIFKQSYNVGSMGFIKEEFRIDHLLEQGRNTVVIQLGTNARSQYWVQSIRIIVR